MKFEEINKIENFTKEQKDWLLSLSKEEKYRVLVNSLLVGLEVFIKLAHIFLSVPPNKGGIPPEVIDDLAENRQAFTDYTRRRKDKPMHEWITEYDDPNAEDKFFKKYKTQLNLKEDISEDLNFNDDE